MRPTRMKLDLISSFRNCRRCAFVKQNIGPTNNKIVIKLRSLKDRQSLYMDSAWNDLEHRFSACRNYLSVPKREMYVKKQFYPDPIYLIIQYTSYSFVNDGKCMWRFENNTNIIIIATVWQTKPTHVFQMLNRSCFKHAPIPSYMGDPVYRINFRNDHFNG